MPPREPVHRLSGQRAVLMRLERKRLPHPIRLAEQSRTAFRGTVMAVAHHVRCGAHCEIETDVGLCPKWAAWARSGHSITSSARFTRATPLSEDPQSVASRLIAHPERSTQIL
jgi:hypothetical protein